MWWTMPEAGEERVGSSSTRVLSVAGRVQRRQATVLTVVPLQLVRPNVDQPRKHFDDTKLAELAESIRRHGLLQPIVVRRSPDGFELIAGERRLRAANLAGLDRLPALVREVEDPLETALIENLQREDLSPLEEAEALAALIGRHGYSHQEVAELLGKSRPYVSNTLALTRLPDEVKDDLHRDGSGISRELLLGVARQEDPDAALVLWRRLKLDALSVRQFRAEQRGVTAERTKVAEVRATARRLNRALKRLLGEQVPRDEAPKLERVLRRTSRLVQRCLAGI